MDSFVKFSMVVVTVAGLAAAGTAQTGNSQTMQAVVPPVQSSCPVSMQVQHASRLTAQIRVGKNGSVIGPDPRETGQHLQLALSNPKEAEISAIRITVYGWDGKGTVTPTVTGAGYGTASQTLNLKVRVGPHQSAKTDVWVKGLTSVDSIDLDAVSYADGLNWRATAAGPCKVIPDPKMLISSNKK